MLEALERELSLGDLLDRLRVICGSFELLGHHTQGEFHHDVTVRIPEGGPLPGRVLVVATNCNGGVKEILAFDEAPAMDAREEHRERQKGGGWCMAAPARRSNG